MKSWSIVLLRRRQKISSACTRAKKAGTVEGREGTDLEKGGVRYESVPTLIFCCREREDNGC